MLVRSHTTIVVSQFPTTSIHNLNRHTKLFSNEGTIYFLLLPSVYKTCQITLLVNLTIQTSDSDIYLWTSMATLNNRTFELSLELCSKRQTKSTSLSSPVLDVTYCNTICNWRPDLIKQSIIMTLALQDDTMSENEFSPSLIVVMLMFIVATCRVMVDSPGTRGST